MLSTCSHHQALSPRHGALGSGAALYLMSIEPAGASGQHREALSYGLTVPQSSGGVRPVELLGIERRLSNVRDWRG
jgi:hypothetical protein